MLSLFFSLFCYFKGQYCVTFVNLCKRDNILYLSKISVQKFANMLTYVIMMISDENRSDSPFIFDAFPGVPAPGNFVI